MMSMYVRFPTGMIIKVTKRKIELKILEVPSILGNHRKPIRRFLPRMQQETKENPLNIVLKKRLFLTEKPVLTVIKYLIKLL